LRSAADGGSLCCKKATSFAKFIIHLPINSLKFGFGRKSLNSTPKRPNIHTLYTKHLAVNSETLT
jgi:hypothetical protein